MKFSYIGIVTPNLSSLGEFYKNVLGFNISARMGDDAIEMERDSIKIVLFSNKAMVEASGDNLFLKKRSTTSLVITLEVSTPEEVDREFERMVKLGANEIKKPEDKFWGQRSAYLGDPDGNTIQLFAELGRNNH